MGATKIEWCDMVWNPITGCEKVSEGCENCWAERMHKRFSKEPFHLVQFHPNRLEEPLKVKKPKKIFVCSMGDFFHPLAKLEWQANVLKVINHCPQHTFLFLTKRVGQMDMFEYVCGGLNKKNIWLGVSAENQRTVVERVSTLINIPASLRFVSIEPMLGAVNLEPYLNNINWVICGGETGPGPCIRPLHPDWVGDLRDQCMKAGVPFFFKQWGEWFCFERERDYHFSRVGKKKAGNLLDGKVWDEFPKIEEV